MIDAFVSEALFRKRLNVCKSCEFIENKEVSLKMKCKQCGCLMYVKTKFAYATCPIDKW
jgi:hypothetical protein